MVIGALTADGSVDQDKTRQLAGRARPMSVAFDVTQDASAALRDCLALGVDRILTSGLSNLSSPCLLDGDVPCVHCLSFDPPSHERSLPATQATPTPPSAERICSGKWSVFLRRER